MGKNAYIREDSIVGEFWGLKWPPKKNVQPK